MGVHPPASPGHTRVGGMPGATAGQLALLVDAAVTVMV